MTSELETLPLTRERAEAMLKEGRVKVAVIGLGRIGLPTAAVFARAGAAVTGVDINPQVVETLQEGSCRFADEPGLQELLSDVVKRRKLVATLDLGIAVSSSQFIIICVPTPVDQTKTPDYSAVKKTSHAVGAALREGSIVIIESTVGPGTVENLIRPILEEESGLTAGRDFGLASCPERSDPGNILENLKSVPRVIGAINGQCGEAVAALYEAVLGVSVIGVKDPKTANAVKLTENLFRDVNVALANEFALLFEKLGIDTYEVINACGTKYNFVPHYPGAGVGGPCLPSNSYYLIAEGLKTGNIPYLIRLAREINDRMPDHVVELVSEAMNEVGKTVKGSRIAILGVTYKPSVRDIQLSPVQKICEGLEGMGAQLVIYDPMLVDEEVYGHKVERCADDAVDGADCIVIGTAHPEFYQLQLRHLSRIVNGRAALVDGRNVLDPATVRDAGFAYRGVGRGTS